MTRFFSIVVLRIAIIAFAVVGTGRADDVLREDFEGAWPPEGWTILHFGDTHTWEPTTDLSQEGETAAWIEFGPAGTVQDEWLVSGPVDLSDLSQAFFEFYEDGAYWDEWGDRHYIMVGAGSQTEVDSFVVALDMRPGVHEQQSFGGRPVRADISAYAGRSDVYVAFRYTGSFADHWYVDDCRIYEPFIHDVALGYLRPDGEHLDDGDVVTPSVLIENRGFSYEGDVQLRIELRESGNVFRIDTIPPAAIPAGQFRFRTFPPFVVNAGHWYEMTASATIAADGNPGNNVMVSAIDAYTLPRSPLGVLLTNDNSTACVDAELALDALMIAQGDEASLIRVHGPQPIPDAIYLAAPGANGFMVRSLGDVTWPHFRLDGAVDAGLDPAEFDNAYEARRTAGSPMAMSLSWDAHLQQAIVVVDNVEPLPADALLRLRVAITEDAVEDLGANGLRYHDQSLRSLFPDTTGAAVPATGGEHRYAVPCPLDPTWDATRLRAVAWVQDDRDGRVLQSVAHMLDDVPITVGVGEPVPPPALSAPTPNPFNPSTRLSFTTGGTGRSRVAVYDLGGRLVRTLVDEPLPAGRHEVVWNGRDDRGRAVGSGSYICRLSTPQGAALRRLTLVR